MSNISAVRVQVPKQDLAKPSFCDGTAEGFSHWVEHLPVANLGETSRQLYTGLTELNRLPLPPDQRFQWLERLRPGTRLTCQGLSKHFLHQPVMLPPRARNVARLAQILQTQLAVGYYEVAQQAAAQKAGLRLNRGDIPLAEAAHRAITELSLVLLRSYQLYQSAPDNLWLSLHQLYRMTADHKLGRQVVDDPEDKSENPLTVNQAYCRALLLGAARSNELRQNDLRDLYQGLGYWATLADLQPATDRTEGHLVDTHADHGPVYREFYHGDPTQCLSLETGELTRYLQKLLADETLESTRVNGCRIADELLHHLAAAWGKLAERSFTRTDADGTLDVCLGLSAVHHYYCNGLSFEELLGKKPSALLNEDTNPFLKETPRDAPDMWDSPFKMSFSEEAESKLATINAQVESTARATRGEEDSQYPITSLKTLNASPGGYCLIWEDEPPLQLKAGEVIGLRETAEAPWSVGAIRWVRQQEDHTEFGVEILSHSAQPYAAKAIRKTGESGDFLRVLLLPAMETIGQPATLLTPRMGFRARQKVLMVQKGAQSFLRLTRKQDATGAYCRFEFESAQALPGGKAPRKPTDTGSGFDSLWESL